GGGAGARAGAHRDYGCLTLIRSDASGLEVQTRDGEWLPVEAPAGGYVVNIGDLLARWTNGRWVSTLHRVVGRDGASPRRQSRASRHERPVFAGRAIETSSPRVVTIFETTPGGMFLTGGAVAPAAAAIASAAARTAITRMAPP